jgi:nucleotide-binding universal stress UspA family protein
VVEAAALIGCVGWTTSAADDWKAVYPQLSRGQSGLLGAVTSRAEAQCVRLALIYALLDGAANIDRPHIRAALAVWEYAEVCAAHIFGASLGDNVADDILRALQNTGREGMSRTALRDLFGRHQSADRIGAALALLASRGRAKMETRQSAGRPTEIWIAMEERRHG